MKDEVRWGDLRPILQDMTDRIARLEQALAASGAAPGELFQAPVFDSAGQVAAQARGIYPTDSVPGPGIPENIVMLATSGRLIEAIKQYRQFTGVGLQEAKAIVEQVAARGY